LRKVFKERPLIPSQNVSICISHNTIIHLDTVGENIRSTAVQQLIKATCQQNQYFELLLFLILN